MHDPLLTLDEAAERLNVSPRTIRREIARGRLAGTFVGRLVRIRLSALERYVDSITEPVE